MSQTSTDRGTAARRRGRQRCALQESPRDAGVPRAINIHLQLLRGIEPHGEQEGEAVDNEEYGENGPEPHA